MFFVFVVFVVLAHPIVRVSAFDVATRAPNPFLACDGAAPLVRTVRAGKVRFPFSCFSEVARAVVAALSTPVEMGVSEQPVALTKSAWPTAAGDPGSMSSGCVAVLSTGQPPGSEILKFRPVLPVERPLRWYSACPSMRRQRSRPPAGRRTERC